MIFSAGEDKGLHEYLAMYLFSKLEGEPDWWWANLLKELETKHKNVVGLLVVRYSRDEVRQKRSWRQRVVAE